MKLDMYFLRRIFIFLFLIFSFFSGKTQNKYFTKSGIISFFSKTDLENIEAINKKVLAIMDLDKNIIEFSVLIKGFEFEKALMQEHFNENYLESDRFPKAVFKGKIDDLPLPIQLADNKTYNINLSGNLTIHGVTKPITAVAVIAVKNQTVAATGNFKIVLSDYQIKIPAVVSNKINKEVIIKIQIPSFQKMN